jgi:hypothetical protein
MRWATEADVSASIDEIDARVNHVTDPGYRAVALNHVQDELTKRRQKTVAWRHMSDSAREPFDLMLTEDQIDQVAAHISTRLQEIENDARQRISRYAA